MKDKAEQGKHPNEKLQLIPVVPQIHEPLSPQQKRDLLRSLRGQTRDETA